MRKQQYKVVSWQGLLQYISKSLVGKGYYYWHLTELPTSKKYKWEQIDEKLIEKYQTDKSKHQRHRRKAKGEANFMYIRYQGMAFVFHTEGDIPEDVEYSDKFYDTRQNPIFLKVSDEVSFRIQLSENGKAHVALDKDTYLGFKAMLHNVSKRKNPELLKSSYNRINGIPSYSGVLKQKKQLAEYCVKQAEKNDIRINTNQKDQKGGTKKTRFLRIGDFRIYSKSKTVQVFEDDPPG